MAKEFHVSRAIDIAAPPERIHALVNDFRAWRSWSPWEGLDPSMDRAYTGADSGVGAVYAWKGNRQAGEGRMEIVESEPLHVGVDLLFAAPMRAHNRVDFALTPAAGGSATRVEWAMTGPQNVVMRLMSAFWKMDKMVGPDLEKGLSTLKATAEGR